MATRAELEYIVKVNDRDLNELKKRVKDTNKALGSEVQSSAAQGSRGLAGFGKTAKVAALGIGLVAGGLGYALKGCIDAAMESQKVNAQTAQVIKTTGGAAKVTASEVSDLASAISAKTGMDDEAIQSGANMLLTFTNIRNEVGKGNDIFNQATGIVADMAQALGTDLASQSIQVGKALNDPIKGIGALSRVGVTFTDQQKEMIKGMVAVGDTAGAQKVILEELGKEFGGQAEAYGKTMPGQMAIFKNSLGNLQEEIGTKFLPILTRALGWINQHWPEISAVVDKVFKAVSFAVTNIIKPTFEFLTRVFTAIVNYVKDHWPEISATVTRIMNGIRTTITNVASAIKSFWDTWGDTILAIAKGVWNQIKTFIETAINSIRGIIKIVTGLIRGDWEQVWNGIKQLTSALLNGIVSSIRNMVGTMLAAAGAFGKAIFDGIVGGVKGIGEKLADLILSPINFIIRKINGIRIPGFKVDLPGPIPDIDFGGVDPIPHIPELAKGGIVTRPTLALIGEAGPEAVVPLSRGAGMGTVVNVYVSGSVTSEYDLAETVRSYLIKQGGRNLGTGLI